MRPARTSEGRRFPSATRRRLAANVICLFNEERPPILNLWPRGAFPRGVVRIKSRPRFRIGSVVEVVNVKFNNGKMARILKEEDGMFLLQSLSGELLYYIEKDGSDSSLRAARDVWCIPSCMRRVWTDR